MKLFRPEAINHHRRRLLGDVVIVQPVGLTVLAFILITFVLTGVSVFYFAGKYNDDLTQGLFATQPSSIAVHATATGVVDEILVEQGASVKKGDALILMRGNHVKKSNKEN